MKRHFQYWGAVYILLILFLGSWFGQYLTMPYQDFWPATFENWQSEWLQLFVQAVLLLALGHWLFKAEKHDVEEIKQDLKEIKEELRRKE